ncbi:MAG: nucleotidyltransferase [Patescibacteria group bacterium]
MSTSSRFDQFLLNIKLTSDQLDDAKTKYDGVCKKIHDNYFSTLYDGSTKLLIGSYGKGTNIRPARDVDVIFKLPSSEYKQSSNGYNYQSYLLQKIKGILQDKYPDSDIKGDGPVVVVNFSNDHFIEVVPAIELTNDKFYIPITTDGGHWKLDDPRALYKLVNDSDNDTGGNTRNLIRMIKKWQEFCDVPIKSLVIEIRAVVFLIAYEHKNKSSTYYDWMVRDYLKELIEKINNTYTLPGLTEKINYGDAWKSKAESAYARAVKACEFEAIKDETSATEEWKKIFGDDFEY